MPPSPSPWAKMEPGNVRVAERTGEPGSMPLMHEFFEVIVKVDGRAEEAQVHQALGFAENGGVIVAQPGATSCAGAGGAGVPPITRKCAHVRR